MPASKQDIRAAAKLRHPNSVRIQMEAKEDFMIPGIAEIADEHPGVRVIVTDGGQRHIYDADTRDELLSILSTQA
jgi:hypothetical protein